MIKLFILSFLFLTACSAISMKNTEHKPLYNFKADMQITVDGKTFDGMAVARIDKVKQLSLVSKASLDVFIVSSCQRYDKLERLDSNWFGGSGKKYSYSYTPSPTEADKVCPLYFQVFDKTGLTDWGFLSFVNDQDLPATSECSGVVSQNIGASACQVKNGFEQAISFSEAISNFIADENCNVIRKSDRSFSYRPGLGFCVATFDTGKRMHRLTALGFNEVFVRGDK